MLTRVLLAAQHSSRSASWRGAGARRSGPKGGCLTQPDSCGRSQPGMTPSVVVGLDNGATSNNATVLEATGRFLVSRLIEAPSRVQEGPGAALDALEDSFQQALFLTGVSRDRVQADRAR